MKISFQNIFQKRLFKLFILLLFPLFIFSCESKSGGDKVTRTSAEYLPSANGTQGEILLVMDSSEWKSPLGDEIREVFLAPQEGILQGESIFTVRWINPLVMPDLLKRHTNLIYVLSMEGEKSGSRKIKKLFTPKSIEQIKTNDKVFSKIDKNLFAKGQKVMYLFAKDDKTLIKHLQKNRDGIRDIFQKEERKRLSRKILGKKIDKPTRTHLKKEHDFKFSFPKGYLLAKEDKKENEGFVFVRNITPQVDRNLFVAYQPYTNVKQLEDEYVIAWRDTLCKEYIFDSDKPESYLVTETQLPPTIRKINFKDKYALEIRGVWRTSIKSMGGSFLSYVLVDEEKGRLYYIEGFLYAPGKDKRELLRELEAILWAFES